MQYRTRRILYYILLALFLMAAPILLFYSLGYTVDISGRVVQKTGGVFIKSKTARLAVSIDSIPIKETGFITGSALITDVPTGMHILRLEHEGYRTWTKSIDVAPLTVIELRNIILISNEIAYATTSGESLPARALVSVPTASTTLDRAGNLFIQKTSTTTTQLENIHSFSNTGAVIYFINNYGFLSSFNVETQKIDTLGHPGFYLAASPAQFFVSPRGNIAVIDSGGGLFVTTGKNTIASIESGVRNAHFDSRGDKLLIQKEKELLVLWITENKIQPFQKEFTMESVIQTPTTIIRSAWFYGDNAHVFLHTDEGVFMTEIDGRGGRNTYEFFTSPMDDFFTSPDTPNRIYAKRGANWYSIEL